MQFKQGVCFYQVDKTKEEVDYSIVFVSSGFKGIWLNMWECYDYTLDIDYASAKENVKLNKQTT